LGRLQWIAPALLLCLIWSWRASGTESNRFVRIYIGVAFAAFFLQSGGDGVDDNAQFELAVATALGLGLAFDTVSQIFGLDESKVDRARAAILAALIARLLLSTRLEPYLVLASPEYRNLFPANAEIAKQETEMRTAAANLEFERAASIRDRVRKLRGLVPGAVGVQ